MLQILNRLINLFVKQAWLAHFYWLLATVLLLLPGSQIPKITWLSLAGFDKLIHIIVFCGLTFSFIAVNKLNSQKLIVVKGLITITFGIGIEYIQENFIPNRSFDIYDIWADVVGCIIAILILIKIKNKFY